MIHCPRCSLKDAVKHGRQQGKQRYRCRGCGCTYTQSWSGKVHPQIKQLAILLHLNGLGFRRIGHVLGVSHVSVQRWWRDQADGFHSSRPAAGSSFEIVELDELWHWHGKKNGPSGFGLLWIEPADESSLGSWVLVGKKP